MLYGEAEEAEATDDVGALGDATATELGDEEDDEPAGAAARLEPDCVVVDEGVGAGDAAVSLGGPAALADVDDALEDDAVRFVPFALALLLDFTFDALRFDPLLRYLAALLDSLSRAE